MLITGANRGIGLALFDHYNKRNHTVIGTARQGGAPFLSLDVTSEPSQNLMAKQLIGQPVDLLVCNAGTYQDKSERLENDYPPQMWADTFATNVTGVFHTIQTLLPNLRAAPAAKIAIISSKMASQKNANGGSYIYRSSKAAVLNLGRNLAIDLKNDAIAVGIYHPGWVRTDMGGRSADISEQEAADGLAARFDELSLDCTGCFLNWDGSSQTF